MWQRPGSARDYNVDADAHCGAGSWWLRTGYPRPVTLNTIPGHATAYGINMATVRGGRVIGQLTDDASGAPVAGATVYVSDADVGAAHGSAVSQPDGTFTIGGLKAGQYVVEVYAAGYIPERVHHMSLATAPATGQLVTVTVGQSSVADETLLRSNTINGTVTNAETGAPLPFIDVYAIPISSTPWPTQQVVLTNNDGTFSLTGLGPATYHICFRDGDLTTVFESACWHDEPWGGGTALTVDGYGIVLNDVDQALHPGAG